MFLEAEHISHSTAQKRSVTTVKEKGDENGGLGLTLEKFLRVTPYRTSGNAILEYGRVLLSSQCLCSGGRLIL